MRLGDDDVDAWQQPERVLGRPSETSVDRARKVGVRFSALTAFLLCQQKSSLRSRLS
jgi:hypothetical protein